MRSQQKQERSGKISSLPDTFRPRSRTATMDSNTRIRPRSKWSAEDVPPCSDFSSGQTPRHTVSSLFPAIAPLLRFGDVRAGGAPFLTVGMFTSNYVATAERLRDSLRQHRMPHALFEVPSIHRSISPKGTDDLGYTKANLILHLIRTVGRPLLYLDTDTVLRRSPSLIRTLCEKTCDFGIFNWLTPEPNDCYLPITAQPPEPGQPDYRRYFGFSHSIDSVAPDQLICSGAVQFWGPTPAAVALLAGWQETVAAQPGVPDDQCLDFAFNNRLSNWPRPLKTHWLPKSYARYAWWIFDEPVIDHPDFPFAGGKLPQIQDASGRKRFYDERATPRPTDGPIPRDCVLDTATGNLFRIRPQGGLEPAASCMRRTWIPQLRKPTPAIASASTGPTVSNRLK